MIPLQIGASRKRLTVLCLGAHSDDLEIGCAATLLRWLGDYEEVEVTWCVLSAAGSREVEARRSALALLEGAAALDVVIGDFPDAYFPDEFRRLKEFLGELRGRCDPDVVITHHLDDRHQDHRLVAELTWQTWRQHLILEYEIPKYEQGFSEATVYVPVVQAVAERKVRHLMEHFPSQRTKPWFTADTLWALMRLRGVESGAPEGWAEAFRVRKAIL